MRIVAARKWRLCGTQSVTNYTNVSNSMPGMQQQGLQHPGSMSSLRSADGCCVREARFQRPYRIGYQGDRQSPQAADPHIGIFVVGRRHLGIRNREETTMAATIFSHWLLAPRGRLRLVFFRQVSFVATPQAAP
jgi:hypothetical protein